ncbi:hypothetical protein JMJ55_02360 [Belnapia sp. T6]|uniref:DUF4089 domain-containing protein n=1 Tax=Belnapia mucosa TaxID=2804532 RepID=A0ABS1V1H6_9PROT|nr:hypothetical protein [Belnapia mucosa]MBL6454148.1 hypothetical protein [Belnapia mucosa]
MPPEITEAEFEALLARAGIPLSPAQRAGILPALPGLAAMQVLIRTPLPEAEAEPATTFSAEAGQ